MNTINYGFGIEYLPKWGINEALREIYQNYMDYGIYTTKVKLLPNDMIKVAILNSYIPNSLEFLRIGNSNKNGNVDAIGHHGEGLKLAFLIFLRLGYSMNIYTKNFILYPRLKEDTNIGNTLEIVYIKNENNYNNFVTTFTCKKEEYYNFINNIITKEDIIYSDNYHGSIVNKPKGNLYSGNLFVCNLDVLSKSYNIKPSQLPLDRDRCLPQSWDVTYHTSKLNEKYEWKHQDTTYDDTKYIENVTEDKAKEYNKKIIDGNTVFVHKETKTLLHNNTIINALKKHKIHNKPVSRRTIIKEKELKAKRKSIFTLLKELKNKYYSNNELKEDINIIIKKLKSEYETKRSFIKSK